MSHRPIRSLALALLLGSAGLASAQPAAPQPPDARGALSPAIPADPTNAALVYWRIWATEPADLADKVREAYSSGTPVDPASDLARTLRENSNVVESLLSASRLPECDFGVQYTSGLLAVVPHLSKIRASARLLGADASLATAEGRTDAAVERTAGVYRVALHVSREPVLISSLVSAAVTGVGHAEVAALAKSGRLTAAQARTILAELDRYDQRDPFGIRRALATEGEVLADSFRRVATGPDAGEALVDTLTRVGVDAGGAPNLEVLRVLDAVGANREIARTRSYYADILQAFDAPDAEARIADLEARSQALEYGPLAPVIGASASRLLQADRKNRAELDATRAILRDVK
ncbi:MAG: hypothetical protein SFY69_10645 [Planctomycetota bacterium]|nr:hypothetical protein [Planctomycetota bacterium]